MCITGGVAPRNRRIRPQKYKVPQGRDYQTTHRSNNLALAGLVMLGELRPAVALRYTAGYA
jgi:hypothetical protein